MRKITEMSQIIINILGGFIVSLICISGAYVQIKIMKSYIQVGMREMISPLTPFWVLSLILIGLCSLMFVIFNLKKKIEMEVEMEERLRPKLIQVWKLGSTELKYQKEEKDFEEIKELFGDEFKINNGLLIELYHQGLENRCQDSSSLNKDVKVALKKYKIKT